MTAFIQEESMPLRTIPFTMEERLVAFWSKVDKRSATSCWEWTGAKNRHGYGNFFHDRSSWKAHRFSYLIAHGEIPDNLHVLHECDNPPCVNPAHLRIGTAKDNMFDRDSRGRQADHRGIYNGRAKLREIDVIKIFTLQKSGQLQTEIATRLGVSQSTISRIIRGDGWRHVEASLDKEQP